MVGREILSADQASILIEAMISSYTNQVCWLIVGMARTAHGQAELSPNAAALQAHVFATACAKRVWTRALTGQSPTN